MKILLVFDDSSLGGTSRSAVEYAKIWQAAGADTTVCAVNGMHPVRLQALENADIPIIESFEMVDDIKPDLVHLHHAAPDPNTNHWVADLIRNLHEPRPAVLTHNIFGQDLEIAYPKEKTIIGLLGHWLAHQYEKQARVNKLHPRCIVPNPQNFQFFRPPSVAERSQARLSVVGDHNRKVILRIGSPNEAKWSTSAYLSLADKVLKSEDMELRLIGCPQSLINALPSHPRISIVPPVQDDFMLRNEYWAADVFAHWAARGESFGNVLLEALGTGLPVIYKSRPTRDNTPWEFINLEGFKYVRTKKSWINEITWPQMRINKTNSMINTPYANNVLERQFRSVVSCVDSHSQHVRPEIAIDALTHQLPAPCNLPQISKLIVGIRHNRLTAIIKAWSLTRRSSG